MKNSQFAVNLHRLGDGVPVSNRSECGVRKIDGLLMQVDV
jgi:hypothetical protein